MARQKFNELVLWNDYIPVNIEDIIDYAHSYGIKVVLGYSWGWKEIAKKAKEVGGLVSGEHGIGYAKKGYMKELLGESQVLLMRGIKKAFDPNNILNPGKVVE